MDVSFLKNTQSASPKLCSQPLQRVQSTKVLGVQISADLQWSEQIRTMLRKANGRLQMLKLLKKFHMPVADLVTVYIGYVRPSLEYAAPVWHSSITVKQQDMIERIQKRATKIILGPRYDTYEDSLIICNLKTLEERRRHLCKSFIDSLMTSEKFRAWLPPSRGDTVSYELRSAAKLGTLRSRTTRYRNSAIPYFCRLYNGNE